MVGRSKFAPTMVTAKVVLSNPPEGRICVINGGGALILKVMGPLVSPPAFRALISTGPVVALEATAREAEIRLGEVFNPLAVTPGMFSRVVPAKLNPLRK